MADEAIRNWREMTAPALQQQHGFKGGYYLTNRTTARSIAITLWETEADLAALDSSGFARQQLARFAAILVGEPVMEQYEVGVQIDKE